MTERDGAWMTRILARFTPEMVNELGVMGKFSNPSDTEYLAEVLEGRLEKILQRYLSRVSPIADLRVERDALCGLDLAAARHLATDDTFRFVATGPSGEGLSVTRGPEGGVCVGLPHVARDSAAPAGDASRYFNVTIQDGFAPGPLVVFLYDLGHAGGFKLAGLERPEP
jgi:hypothetical protein